MATIEERIMCKAKELGADLVGITDIASLQNSPSHLLLSSVGDKIDGEYSHSNKTEFYKVVWPENAKSVLVIGLSHPQNKPELDWKISNGGTPGNSTLININKKLSKWIEEMEHVKTHPMHYYVEKGGIYLKDAAVLAGLGCIGKNNLLITPEFESKIRLRGMLLEAALESTGSIKFDPCNNCPEYCRKSCPQEAFGAKVAFPNYSIMNTLPARDAFYKRSRCLFQMNADREVLGALTHGETAGGMDTGTIQKTILTGVKHCRQCELVCPVEPM